jgi:hypothetical protein
MPVFAQQGQRTDYGDTCTVRSSDVLGPSSMWPFLFRNLHSGPLNTISSSIDSNTPAYERVTRSHLAISEAQSVSRKRSVCVCEQKFELDKITISLHDVIRATCLC